MRRQDADRAHVELEAFEEKWGQRLPVITNTWLDAREDVTPFLGFPPEVRRGIHFDAASPTPKTDRHYLTHTTPATIVIN